MKKSKLLSILATVVLSVSLLVGCGSSGGNSTDSKDSAEKSVKITFLNTKGEIAASLEDAAKAFTEENPNITVDIVQAGAGESPFQKVSSMYAAGNAPSLIMIDPSDVSKFSDKFADLSSEKWVEDAAEGTLDAGKVDGKVMGLPLTVEGYGLIYNKSVLDKASVDPASIKTTKDLEDAFAKITENGVAPMVLSPMDWSLGAHFLPTVYMDQTSEAGAADQFVQDIKDGKVELNSNEVFNGIMTTFDVLKANNIDKVSPLAGTYEKASEYLGKGEAAFWFMGNWAWPQIKEFDEADGQYGFIPVPVSNNADDYGNSQIYAGSSKFIGVDTKNNDEDQQAAAKKFLEWLVYSEAGQDFIVNKANLIPAFTNITLEIADPLGNSIKEYIESGKVIPCITTLPGDHWAQLGGSMQKYLDGKSDKAALASEIEKYWENIKE